MRKVQFEISTLAKNRKEADENFLNMSKMWECDIEVEQVVIKPVRMTSFNYKLVLTYNKRLDRKITWDKERK